MWIPELRITMGCLLWIPGGEVVSDAQQPIAWRLDILAPVSWEMLTPLS